MCLCNSPEDLYLAHLLPSWEMCRIKDFRLFTHEHTLLLFWALSLPLARYQLNVLSYSWDGALEMKCCKRLEYKNMCD